ncbi:hypothetical protein LEMLEM_LOCUS5842 [Lemmus lemmus]
MQTIPFVLRIQNRNPSLNRQSLRHPGFLMTAASRLSPPQPRQSSQRLWKPRSLSSPAPSAPALSPAVCPNRCPGPSAPHRRQLLLTSAPDRKGCEGPVIVSRPRGLADPPDAAPTSIFAVPLAASPRPHRSTGPAGFRMRHFRNEERRRPLIGRNPGRASREPSQSRAELPAGSLSPPGAWWDDGM